MYIADELDGKLPIEIKAVEEGTPVEVGNVLMTVENTDKQCYWLPNYLESLLLQVWYPSTVATLSAEVRKLCNFYLEVTESSKENLDFMLHDFNNIYGFSVQATEHSVMTSLGEEGEVKQAINVIDNAKDGILSIVIDSYNYREFLKQASTKGSKLNDKVNEFLEKTDGNKIVFRPDSGEPVSTTLDCLNILGEGFGTVKTTKGYKIFAKNIGLLWGDGLNYHKIRDILFGMKSNGWAAQNIIFGMGGGLHSSVNRDTQRNAFKCSAQLRNGTWYDIFKNPLDSSKKSKTGRLKLVKENSHFKTVPISDERKDYLQTVFKNGELIRKENFWDIKNRTLTYTRKR